MQIVPGGAVPEMTKALEHVKAVLEASGSGVEKVVKATIFLQDMADFANVNEVYKKGKTFSGLCNLVYKYFVLPQQVVMQFIR